MGEYFKDWRLISLKLCLFLMGTMVVYFNIKGYEILFSDDKIFGLVSPFSLLLAIAEISVLTWTYVVISNWPNVSRLIKIIIFFLVPSFSFLCFTGVNSYLSTLSTTEIRKLKEVEVQNENSNEYLAMRASEVETLKIQIEQIRHETDTVLKKRADYSSQISDLYAKASERRLKAARCDEVPDCANSVKAFIDQAKLITRQIDDLDSRNERLNNKLHSYEDKLETTLNEISEIKRKNTENINQYAGTESTYDMKKSAYEDIIITISAWFGLSPKEPFNIFVNLISFLIYPVYFMLNLYIALDSDENKTVRNKKNEEIEKRRSKRRELKSLRAKLLAKIVKYQRMKILRASYQAKKRLELRRLIAEKKKSNREKVYTKLLGYLSVWAHRRKKTKIVIETKIVETEKVMQIEVEKIIEVEKEITKEIEVIVEKEIEVIVEKEVEVIKEVPYELKVEVPVEVDRIVEVEKEVPVFIEKIKKVPEPVFINDPQIIIHERIIPVPADITGEELEKLLNAQPRLNETARAEQDQSDTAAESTCNPPVDSREYESEPFEPENRDDSTKGHDPKPESERPTKPKNKDALQPEL